MCLISFLYLDTYLYFNLLYILHLDLFSVFHLKIIFVLFFHADLSS